MSIQILTQHAYPLPDHTYLSLVLAHLPHAAYRPYVVWTFNASTDTYQRGDYYPDEATARAGFAQRYRRLCRAYAM